MKSLAFIARRGVAGAALLWGLVLPPLAAQSQIQTAGAFFKQISDYYGGIYDMEATVQITVQKRNMSARLSYKRPDLLRMDFTVPKNQVLVFNGEALTIYLPENSAILNQAASNSTEGARLASPQGLSLMSRYYAIAYETGQAPAPLYAGSEEMTVNLILTPKTASEGFRRIRLSVNPSLHLIRRVEALTAPGDTIVILFSDYALNRGISDQRFIYDSPASANIYENFLFSE